MTEFADAPYRFFREGTVRGRALIEAQSAADQAQIRDAVEQAVKSAHGPEGPWRIPLPSIVVVARKPA
ncbi:MAG: hypothetical protein HRU30_03550 [Rhodobacteraceae bacterium]|nr:hypothetical protein [Paracoccaceae bacterium]